jgi:hypothetical protein
MNRMANFRVRFGTMMKQVFAALTPQAMIVYGAPAHSAQDDTVFGVNACFRWRFSWVRLWMEQSKGNGRSFDSASLRSR